MGRRLSPRKVWGEDGQQGERAQSLVELAIVMPLIVVLFISIVEVGAALRSYLIVMNANREAARLASRGQFLSGTNVDVDAALRVFDWASEAAGYEMSGRPFLRFDDSQGDPNAAGFLTYIPIDEDCVPAANQANPTTVSIGDPYLGGGVDQPVASRVDAAALYVRYCRDLRAINSRRVAEGYPPLTSDLVIVELYYRHEQLLKVPIFRLPFVSFLLPDPIIMHTETLMRLASDARVR
ncbi:MAG: pilus assembly protein [Chloroflexi bacterium]|nr:MAG: pilus assembly protein [Chloroflexota bacterium]